MNTKDNYPSENNEIIEYKDFYLIKENIIFKIIVGIIGNKILIKSNNYFITFGLNDFKLLTKLLFNTINEAYEFIINLFEENKVIINNININKTIKLLLYINNIEKNIEIILIYNKKNKNNIINELNNNKLKNDINILKDEINILKKEINILKSFHNNYNLKDFNKNKIINNKEFNKDYNINFNTNPKDIKYSNDLIKDSYAYSCLDNTFSIFKSINEILYLIYANENKSIICYNLIENKKIKEIKNAHKQFIINFRYFLDKINKRDLIISISFKDIKLWNINNWLCLTHIQNINNSGSILSSCFLNDNNKNYIITSSNSGEITESIKIYDFKGNKIKEINDSNYRTIFIDTFYDNKLFKTYIITGNNGYSKSYDFNENKNYFKYYEYNDKEDHNSLIIINNKDIIKLIESSEEGYIRIWNFHHGELIDKIKVIDNELYGICLWNEDYLFVGCDDETIKLIDLKNKNIVKNLIGHNNSVLTIKKIIHPKFGECIISQGWVKSEIKLWSNKY